MYKTIIASIIIATFIILGLIGIKVILKKCNHYIPTAYLCTDQSSKPSVLEKTTMEMGKTLYFCYQCPHDPSKYVFTLNEDMHVEVWNEGMLLWSGDKKCISEEAWNEIDRFIHSTPIRK